ncbi:ABC transporter ATP-binding protein [Noviherbaspirillum denitrificans]|uniref:ABC transporter ATP-binding protein n=1 Tax=Noviherbaspirillum denitrificans TaxID=1968433 RepID=A0A254T6J6_9BURK|nr:ABC transporter ATP-binding protein [Noviherbaspirillum denitrificans]OWW18281.1 ABC transporter ATP-binding protein [Noviherbaspirillum denitrificans]
MTNLLSAKSLNKRFDAVVAADNISIDVPVAQRLSLIGSNGAGKTTFVNMVTGYLRPDSRSISLEGSDITAMAPRHVARLGICRSFQIPQLCLELTAMENLLVAVAAAHPAGLSIWKPADEADRVQRAEQLLERFGLAAFAERRVTEMPGGVRKLLDIAMAMARHPKLLLLDEPTSGVSAEEKFVAMERIMAGLSHEAVTVVFVEHDMDIVARFSERVIAFYSGRIIADATPDAVLMNPEVKRYVTGGHA